MLERSFAVHPDIESKKPQPVHLVSQEPGFMYSTLACAALSRARRGIASGFREECSGSDLRVGDGTIEFGPTHGVVLTGSEGVWDVLVVTGSINFHSFTINTLQAQGRTSSFSLLVGKSYLLLGGGQVKRPVALGNRRAGTIADLVRWQIQGGVAMGRIRGARASGVMPLTPVAAGLHGPQLLTLFPVNRPLVLESVFVAPVRAHLLAPRARERLLNRFPKLLLNHLRCDAVEASSQRRVLGQRALQLPLLPNLEHDRGGVGERVVVPRRRVEREVDLAKARPFPHQPEHLPVPGDESDLAGAHEEEGALARRLLEPLALLEPEDGGTVFEQR
mmetsp:Transcript_64846/g.135209  ORF Transcript_64846/g.135209 Transcript_64846/m.135209 type:complete len:333 (-) Transcript_64846:32-1030(-)